MDYLMFFLQLSRGIGRWFISKPCEISRERGYGSVISRPVRRCKGVLYFPSEDLFGVIRLQTGRHYFVYQAGSPLALREVSRAHTCTYSQNGGGVMRWGYENLKGENTNKYHSFKKSLSCLMTHGCTILTVQDCTIMKSL